MAQESRVPLLLLSSIVIASTAVAQAPAGGEFQVNSSTGWNEELPSVASDPQGRFTVVWARWNGTTHTMIGRRFDAAAAPQGADFVINTSGVGQVFSFRPRVAYEADGGFVVVWPGAGSPPGTSNVVGRRYDAAGAPRGPEFLVATVGAQSVAQHVSAGSGGGFVVTWRDDSGTMRARPYDPSGVGLGTVVVGAGFQALPSITMTPDRGFIVAWSVNAVPYTVWAQQFDPNGVPRGPAFPVASGGNFKHLVEIASDASGSFTVSWHDSGPSQGDDGGPIVRRFAANGTPLTGEIAVSTFTPGIQSQPMVAMAPNGHVVVTWDSIPINPNCPPPPLPCTHPSPQDGSGRGVYGRFLDPSGNPLGGEFRVNEHTTGYQDTSAVATDATGRFIVTWQDWQRNGIYARRFASLTASRLDVDRTATGASNQNGILEAGETVAIDPAWRNATSAPLTYSTASAMFAGPPGPVYSMVDGAARYGTFAPGATVSCRNQADCYAASVVGPRPAPHWDAVLTEQLANGPSKPWVVHVGESFADVPLSSPYYRFVETLFHTGVTGGCGTGVYCPVASVPREQMPVFVLRSYLPALVPPACVAGSELFGDVPASSPYCRWIEELARRGVVAGCGGGNYCPTQTVSRETMAVYLGATLGLNPPACGTPVFADVPASSPFCRWIEELARRGVVTGCGGGNYCPTAPVARDQMAVFLSVTFGLVLYGP